MGELVGWEVEAVGGGLILIYSCASRDAMSDEVMSDDVPT